MTYPIILSLDPGSTNMGVSLITLNKKDQPVVIKNSLFKYPIKNLTKNYRAAVANFMAELQTYLDYNPQLVIMERYQNRGKFSGTTIESVNIMIGIVSAVTTVPFKLVPAVQWKNAVQRRFDFNLDDAYVRCGTTPHQFDAVMIGTWGMELALRRQLNYTIPYMIKQAEKSSLVKLHNRKLKDVKLPPRLEGKSKASRGSKTGKGIE